jgi:hypothetical protein
MDNGGETQLGKRSHRRSRNISEDINNWNFVEISFEDGRCLSVLGTCLYGSAESSCFVTGQAISKGFS